VELSDALLVQRRALPQLHVLFITDPVNEGYGATPSGQLALLRAGGVEVVSVDLDTLRDANLVYSGFYRLALSWWDRPGGPWGIEARRLNGKADHRKLALADDGASGLSAVIASANPYDPESGWSNAALRVTGPALAALLASELAIAHDAGWRGADAAFTPAAGMGACAAAAAPDPAATSTVQVLTEGAIAAALLERLGASARGDSIDVAMRFFSARSVAEALLAAARRGVRVRLILDPNLQAGTRSAGIPNQPTASELVARSHGAIHVRWYRTHGERFQAALVMIYGRERFWLAGGSANLTRRSLEDYNLDADVAVETTRGAPVAQQALGYFEALWANRAALGIEYTTDFGVYSNPAQLDYWLGRWVEGAGLSTF
jgi:phosphatidylserine/phosphatidylglycerophosphate/cardiolipin synthase-like enzyme